MSTLTVPVLLTLEQACQLLNCKRSRIYYLTSSKRIPFIKLGSSLRFDQGTLLKWVERHRQGPTA